MLLPAFSALRGAEISTWDASSPSFPRGAGSRRGSPLPQKSPRHWRLFECHARLLGRGGDRPDPLVEGNRQEEIETKEGLAAPILVCVERKRIGRLVSERERPQRRAGGLGPLTELEG